MRRIPLVLCMIVLASACVNLRKPEEVAKCSTAGTCIDNKKDAAPSDTARSDKGTGIESPIIEGPDGAQPSIDGTVFPPELDGGPALPDAEEDGPIAPTDGDGPNDLPPIDPPDAPQDYPVVPPDAREVAPERPRDVNYDVAAGICATKPAGTPCRPAVGPCDIAENCDGRNADCPADKLQPASKECRAAAGDCDIAETCSGASPDCPDDGFKQAGTVCRKAAGQCDYAEICSGASAECPGDALKQSSAVCRVAVSLCDPAENCSGLNANCPQDVPAYTRLAAPNGVTATPGELQASLTWNEVAGATGYNIKRGTIPGGPYTTIATAVASPPFVNTSLDNTKTYYYVLTSINTIPSCESATVSMEASVKPTGVCDRPAAPTVTPTAGNGQVTLSWDAIAGATAYTVDRSETSGTGYASLASVMAPTTTYVDQAVTFGKTYYYRVTTKGACDSDPSNEVSAAPKCVPEATTPTGLKATTPNTGGVVGLTWNAVPGAKTTDRYYIMRSTGVTYAKIDEVIPPAISYSDDSAVNDTAYNYAVTYNNGTCTSGYSNVAPATAKCVMEEPVLTVTPGNKKVDLSWTQPANGSLDSYKVYRKDTGSYTLLTTITSAGSTTYTDPTAANGTTYTFYVTAVGNCTADSDPKTAVPVCTPLGAPTNLKATAGDKQVALNWNAVAGADHYTVKRGAATGGPYTALTPPSPITTNSFTDTAVTNGTTYFYVVTASNGTCDSLDSGEGSAKPEVCASQGTPGKPTLTLTSSSQVKVDWTAADPAPSGGYNILRDTSPTGSTSVGSVSGSTVTFTDPLADVTIDGKTLYYYKVKAIGSCSTTSDYTSITPTCVKPAKPVASVTAKDDGTIQITWTTIEGATAYTVSSSTTDGGPYTPIPAATNITATTYNDTGLTNTTMHYYVVMASNGNQQCKSDDSAQLSARSCIIPDPPKNLTATRTGHKQVSLAWTNSPGTNITYGVQRSNSSGSAYTPVDSPDLPTSSTSFVDTSASNTSAQYYVVTARSDSAGICSSTSSGEASVPACIIRTSANDRYRLSPASKASFCLVTCWDISGWGSANMSGRTLTVNGSSTVNPLPPKGNGGYVFDISISATPTEPEIWWWGTKHDCP